MNDLASLDRIMFRFAPSAFGGVSAPSHYRTAEGSGRTDLPRDLGVRLRSLLENSSTYRRWPARFERMASRTRMSTSDDNGSGVISGVENSFLHIDLAALEDGEASDELQHKLHSWFACDPGYAMNTLFGFTARNRMPLEAMYALCASLGRLKDQTSRPYVLGFLTQTLRDGDDSTRDAALLGLGHLNDSACVPALEQALAKEPRAFLRDTIREILSDITS